MDFVDLREGPLDIGEAFKLVTDPSCGAIASFVGTTRDNFDGRQVVSLEYEAYLPMARAELEKVCAELRRRFPAVARVAILHRLGLCPVSEASVVITVSSPHRKEALEACGVAIELLKAQVPIWKKELYADGSCSWKENCECAWSAQHNSMS